MKKTLIIIPTYNEKENIINIINAVLRLGLNLEILIVDDNSPDGTGELVKAKSLHNPKVHLIQREKKQGIGRAYITGFRYALENNYDYIMEMDADFSHNPKYIPEFLREIENYDLVLGSRYIKKGKVKNWGFLRRLISRGGSLYARTILRIKVRDLTGGFKCFRKETLKKIDIDNIYSNGYSFQIELTYKVIKKGLKAKEIPIIFTDRKVGRSKMSKKIFIEAFFSVWRMRFFHFPELLICLFAFIALTIFVDSIPGLHIDEAWTFYRLKEIAGGFRPINGMNSYTGALHQYLLYPFLQTFGYRPSVLRFASALFNTLSLLLAMLLITELYPQKRKIRIWFGALLCTYPLYIGFSRFAIEITALGPLLTVAGLLFMVKSIKTRKIAFALLAGICLGLSSYNHAIALAVPMALATSMFIIYRLKFLRSQTTWFGLIGFLLGFFPRIYSILHGSANSIWKEQLTNIKTFRFFSDLVWLPKILVRICNGDLLYQRFVGKCFLPVVPYITLGLIIFLIGRILMVRKEKITKLDLNVILFWLFLILFTTAITPFFSIRYFLLPLFFIPYFLIKLAQPLQKHKKRPIRILAAGMLTSIIALNLLYLTVNYYFAFLSTGGTINTFSLGNRLVDTSNHFIGTKRLYQQLIDEKIEIVIAQNFITSPLGVYDFKNQKLNLIAQEPTSLPADNRRFILKKTALIYYNGPTSVKCREIVYPVKELPATESIRYRLKPGFDSKFLVFIACPKIKSKAGKVAMIIAK